jgi:hypothetical protein
MKLEKESIQQSIVQNKKIELNSFFGIDHENNNTSIIMFDTNLFDTENDDSLDTYMENYTVTNLNNIVNGIVCTSGSIINNVFRPVYTIKQSSEPSKFIDKLNNLLNVTPTRSRKFIFNSDSYFYNDLTKSNTKSESDSGMNMDQH